MRRPGSGLATGLGRPLRPSASGPHPHRGGEEDPRTCDRTPEPRTPLSGRKVRPRPARIAAALALFALLALLPSGARAQTPVGTPIDNVGTATYDLGASTGLVQNSNLVRITVEALRTSSTLEFLQYAPGAGGAQSVPVPPSQCSATGLGAGPFNPVPPPPTASGAPLALPGPLDLLPATTYGLGDPLFLRLTDGDQNLDSAVVETVLVTVTSPAGDRELVRLSETGPDTGVFTGHLQTADAPVALYDCALQTAEDELLGSTYVDVADGTDTSTDAAPVSPLSVV